MKKKSLGGCLMIAGLHIIFGCIFLFMIILAIASLATGDPMGAIIGVAIIGLALILLGLYLNDD